MRSFLIIVPLFAAIASLSGCSGADSVDVGSVPVLDTRGYLLKDDGSDFSTKSIVDAVEVIAGGTPSYSVRLLLPAPLEANEQIEIQARRPVATDYKTIFILKAADLTKGSHSDFWATLNPARVEEPLVPTPLLITQMRTAAETGEWRIRRTRAGVGQTTGLLLPDRPLTYGVTVPDTSEGLAAGTQGLATIRERVGGITVSGQLPVADAATLGTVLEAHLVVQASADPASSVVLEAPLTVVSSPTLVKVSTTIEVLANDLDPKLDPQVKYLSTGLHLGVGFLRLKVVRNGTERLIKFKIGPTNP